MSIKVKKISKYERRYPEFVVGIVWGVSISYVVPSEILITNHIIMAMWVLLYTFILLYKVVNDTSDKYGKSLSTGNDDYFFNYNKLYDWLFDDYNYALTSDCQSSQVMDFDECLDRIKKEAFQFKTIKLREIKENIEPEITRYFDKLKQNEVSMCYLKDFYVSTHYETNVLGETMTAIEWTVKLSLQWENGSFYSNPYDEMLIGVFVRREREEVSETKQSRVIEFLPKIKIGES
jgi:hypothetical protein